MDTLDDFMMARPATADRPLMGLTLLLVEDSRFAADGVRLLCQRSGARIRRADSLESAHRHLRVYRPSVVLVDLGLPDGSGADLIGELARSSPRIPAILATSGDPAGRAVSRAAGADGFLSKPILRLAEFQAAILAHLPPEQQPAGARLVSSEAIEPDPLAYRDDLASVAGRLRRGPGPDDIDYLTQFIGGVAESAGDGDMCRAVAALAAARAAGGQTGQSSTRLSALVESRIAPNGPL